MNVVSSPAVSQAPNPYSPTPEQIEKAVREAPPLTPEQIKLYREKGITPEKAKRCIAGTTLILSEFRKSLIETSQERAKLLQERAKIDQEIAEAKAMQARGQAKQAEGLKILQEVEAERRAGLAKTFYAIFHGKTPLPANQIDEIFTKYLADKSLSVEDNHEEKRCYPKLNSIKPVLQYTADYPKAFDKLDLRHLKDAMEKVAVANLTAYLAHPACPIKAVAISRELSAEKQAMLIQAMVARKNSPLPLKVVF